MITLELDEEEASLIMFALENTLKTAKRQPPPENMVDCARQIAEKYKTSLEKNNE